MAEAKVTRSLLLCSLQILLGCSSNATPELPRQPTMHVAPTAQLDQVPSTAETSEEAITRTFTSRQEQIEDCIQLYTHGVPTEPVTLNILFALAQDGTVRSARLSPLYLEHTEAGRCFLEVARAIRFPASRTRVRFSVPITLSSESADLAAPEADASRPPRRLPPGSI
jgi:hypothetical protein